MGMADHQIAQQQSPPSKAPKLRRRSGKPAPLAEESSRLKTANLDRQRKKRATPLNPVLLVVQKCPLLVWSAFLAAMLLVGGLAMLRLTDPDYVGKEQPSAAKTATNAQNTVLQDESQNTQSGWLYGAIALGCATGAWVILRQFNGTRKRRKLRKPLKSRPISRQRATQQRKKKPFSPHRKEPISEASQATNPSTTGAIGAATRAIPPLIPSLPDDRNQVKLAENMDIRKRHPLSYLLRNP